MCSEVGSRHSTDNKKYAGIKILADGPASGHVSFHNQLSWGKLHLSCISQGSTFLKYSNNNNKKDIAFTVCLDL